MATASNTGAGGSTASASNTGAGGSIAGAVANILTGGSGGGAPKRCKSKDDSGGSTGLGALIGGAAATALGIPPQVGASAGGFLEGVFGGGGGGEGEACRQEISIAAFPCPKVDDEGVSGAWFVSQAISIAVAIWAASETYKAAREDYNIGMRYYKLAYEQWDFHKQAFQPLEQQELDEVWADPHHSPDYANAVNGHTHSIDNIFAAADRQRVLFMHRYCICHDIADFTRSQLTQSTVFGDSSNFARRYAEKLSQERNDIRHSRRIAAAGRGRSILSNSGELANKGSQFTGAYARAMGELSSNAATFAGYMGNRQDTMYNPDRDRPNHRADTFTVLRDTNVLEQMSRSDLTRAYKQGISFNGANNVITHQGVDPSHIVRTNDRV